MANRWGKRKQWQTLFWGGSKMVIAAMKLKDAWKKSYDQPRQQIKKQRHYFADHHTYSQSYGFSRSHVLIWELDHKEGRTLKNRWFWTGVLEKMLKSPLDSKEIKPVNLKGNQPWILIGRTDAEVEAPILWPPDANIWPWCWGKLKAEGEEGYWGWHGWITSQMQWTWTWASSGRW